MRIRTSRGTAGCSLHSCSRWPLLSGATTSQTLRTPLPAIVTSRHENQLSNHPCSPPLRCAQSNNTSLGFSHLLSQNPTVGWFRVSVNLGFRAQSVCRGCAPRFHPRPSRPLPGPPAHRSSASFRNMRLAARSLQWPRTTKLSAGMRPEGQVSPARNPSTVPSIGFNCAFSVVQAR